MAPAPGDAASPLREGASADPQARLGGRVPDAVTRAAAEAGPVAPVRERAGVGEAGSEEIGRAAGAPDETISAGFGARVARLRERAGWSQGALARATGLSQPAISFIEAGSRTPGIDTAGLIADALGVTVGELLGERHATLSDEEAHLVYDLRRAPMRVREEVAEYLAYRVARAKREP